MENFVKIKKHHKTDRMTVIQYDKFMLNLARKKAKKQKDLIKFSRQHCKKCWDFED